MCPSYFTCTLLRDDSHVVSDRHVESYNRYLIRFHLVFWLGLPLTQLVNFYHVCHRRGPPHDEQNGKVNWMGEAFGDVVIKCNFFRSACVFDNCKLTTYYEISQHSRTIDKRDYRKTFLLRWSLRLTRTLRVQGQMRISYIILLQILFYYIANRFYMHMHKISIFQRWQVCIYTILSKTY